MKIFSTGKLLSKEFKKITVASTSTGWDFTKQSSIDRLTQEIVNYNVFVNSAYIQSDIQQLLLNTVHSIWMRENIPGHIFNIGTTLENTDNNTDYANSKRQLRSYSMKLNDETGITGVKVSYVIVGGVGEQHVTPSQIADTIQWIAQQQIRIPLIQLDSVKT